MWFNIILQNTTSVPPASPQIAPHKYISRSASNKLPHNINIHTHPFLPLHDYNSMGEFEGLPAFVKETLREKAIDCKPIGRQRGAERFPCLLEKGGELADGDELPPIKDWRLNLTALSKVFNLYFVAYCDQLYVYRPQYPSQRLPLEPAIILNPARLDPGKPGFVDQEDPHSINNVFIDFLGELEIILVACDDGDVVGYYTHKIEDVLNHTTIEEEMVEHEFHFFAYNVGLSAWGLSIHSLSRKIAIGSNTQDITIYSFGLDLAMDGCVRLPIDGEMVKLEDPMWRLSDKTIVFKEFGGNIPSVAFCNNDEDREGRLIAVGTISGGITILNLRTLQALEYLQIGFCRQYDRVGSCYCCPSNLHHASWGLIWLDRKSFLPVSRQIPQDRSGSGHVRFQNAWNGSDKANVVPDADGIGHTSYFPLMPNKAPGTSQETRIQEVECNFNQEQIDLISSITWTERRRRARYGSIPAPPGEDVCTAQDLRWHSSWEPRENTSVEEWGAVFESSLKIAQYKFFDDAEVEGTPDDAGPDYRHPNIPCPLFVASKRDACIIPPQGKSKPLEPIIGYCNVLGQIVVDCEEEDNPKPWFDNEQLDRLSLQAHIPELSLLITATPKGRAAIYTLCQSPDGPNEAPVYFHRLDWMLPFKSQEDAGERPLAKLIGIATGPVQGTIAPLRNGVHGESLRHRLMLHYSDHTILSYLLQKEEDRIIWYDGESSGPYREFLAAREKDRMPKRLSRRGPPQIRQQDLVWEDGGLTGPL
ncbi:F-actin-capping protein subunit alpha [Venturia nashicola]|uniref:F-actin-capping protein subunit alpha n=1 Tax=Venturia nashicola TaxID=86259 RepID=A0A4Z1PBN7_9PEZI|nr:F-actin-capping protein subunit alpha [Venturia nashicola]TLD31753.1 F-actin-capping protein subunit alpha [Venturia nashicola]